MIDTLAIISPSVDEETARAAESILQTRSCVENSTGESVYEIVSGSLDGSWDSRVHVRVLREEIVVLKSWYDPHGPSQTVMRPCAPYLRVEGSVHKAMLGHNVFGGPLDPVRSTAWLVKDVERRLGVAVPPWDAWREVRADWAEVYDLGSFEACVEFINGLALARYPRRKVCRYSAEAVMFAGTTTTTKCYHKGPEFSKNDFRRVEKLFGLGYARDVQERANQLLRVEVTVKSKKLNADLGEKPSVLCVTREYLEALHDREVHRIIREGESDMQTVRRNEDVRRRLHALYGMEQGSRLFGTWSSFVMVGEGEVRRTMTRRTFYRHRKMLEDAQCSWVGTDVHVIRCSAIPEGFAPRRQDSRRLCDEAPAVIAALAAA